MHELWGDQRLLLGEGGSRRTEGVAGDTAAVVLGCGSPPSGGGVVAGTEPARGALGRPAEVVLTVTRNATANAA